MLQITQPQYDALTADSHRRFAAKLKRVLTAHPVVGAAANAKPEAWYQTVVDVALKHGVTAEVDVGELAAQMLTRGEDLLKSPAVRAVLEDPDISSFLKVVQISERRMLLDWKVM